MLVQPVFHEIKAWPDCDLTQFVRCERWPKEFLQYQHVSVKPKRPINSPYAGPSNAVDELAKQRHALRLLDFLRDWPIDDCSPLVDQLGICSDNSRCGHRMSSKQPSLRWPPSCRRLHSRKESTGHITKSNNFTHPREVSKPSAAPGSLARNGSTASTDQRWDASALPPTPDISPQRPTGCDGPKD